MESADGGRDCIASGWERHASGLIPVEWPFAAVTGGARVVLTPAYGSWGAYPGCQTETVVASRAETGRVAGTAALACRAR